MATTIKDIEYIFQSHQDFWAEQRPKLKRYKDAVSTQFWEGQGYSCDDLTVDTPYAHKLQEQYVSVLFRVEPGVLVSPDSMTRNDTKKVEALANKWLNTKRKPFENSTRLALTYPQAYTKVEPKETPPKKKATIADILDCPLKCLNPWDVIVDRDAESWETMRFAGHIYHLSLKDTKSKYGEHRYVPKVEKNFWNPIEETNELPDKFKSIQIVEFYDLEEDSLYIFTPDTGSGWMILFEGRIPIRSENDDPMLPIAPLYFDWLPDQPLIGISTIGHFYDQIREINFARTKRMDIVNKNSVGWVVDSSVIDDPGFSGFQQMRDGEILKMNLGGRSLESAFQRVDQNSLGSDFNTAVAETQADYERASNLPVQSRGESTGITATEVGFLNNYAANTIGKMNREKSQMIEAISQIYIRLVATRLDEKDSVNLTVDGEAQILKGSDLEGSFIFTSVDGNTSPITREQKKFAILQQAPVLMTLGVPKKTILEKINDYWEWGNDLVSEETPTILGALPPPPPQNPTEVPGVP